MNDLRMLPILLLLACSGADDTDTSDTDTDADTDTDTDSDTDTDTDTGPYASGLAFRARFDGTSTDSGPDALALTTGTPTWTTDRHGAAGMAAEAGSCLTYAGFENNGASGAFSFAAWVRPGSTFSGGSRQTLSAQGGGFYQVYRTGGSWTFEIYTGTPTRSPTFVSATTTADASTWTHLAFVYDVTNGGVFYVDGVAATTTGTGADNLQSTTASLLVGCGGDASFDADFDEVALWDRRLTVDEVVALAAD